MSATAMGPGSAPQETTGRYLVYFAPGTTAEGARILDRAVGLRVATQPEAALGPIRLEDGEAVILEKLGVAVVQPGPPQEKILNEMGWRASYIESVEPDRILRAIPDVITRMSSEEINAIFKEYGDTTWGLKMTGVENSRFSGKGVRLAVLDTGMDVDHPDFKGRRIISQSFIRGQEVRDCNGHGTHCIGTACGPQVPTVLPRYGIAFGCDLYAGKVLNDAGSGSDGELAAGMNWAVTNQCRIISISLGSVCPEQSYSKGFETRARRILEGGTIIVAAAGNDSRRNSEGAPRPATHPANCPSVVSVGAVDIGMQVADFSNGGKVDIAAPGVHIHSCVPGSQRYKTFSGTSMAVPHVSGIAALWAEKFPEATGLELRHLLIQNALKLSHPNTDVGAGLVQAP